uniref:RxLR effector candidate protein n=1 Tax=Peronospora matthiolae TaxID=2874970 RepID=A0AAV1V537_9STRA
MRVHLAALIVSGFPFASTAAVLHISEPGSLRINTNGVGPVRRRLQPDPSDGEEREGIPAALEAHLTEHVALTTFGLEKKSAAPFAWPHRIARDSDIPLDYKRIVYDYASTYEVEDLRSMKRLTTTYGDVVVAETINALKSAESKVVLDFAAEMQRKQLRLWKEEGLESDGLFELLKLNERFPKEDVHTSPSARLASLLNDPIFASWKAFVHYWNNVDPVGTMIETLVKYYGDDELVKRLANVKDVEDSKDVAMKLGKVQNLLDRMDRQKNPKEYATWESLRDFYGLHLKLFRDAESQTRHDVPK